MDDREAFAKRLAEARAKRGLDQPEQGASSRPSNVLGTGLRAGVEVVSALIVGVVIGLGLDHLLGTGPWLFLVFFLLGAAAGVLNVYRLFDPRYGAWKNGRLVGPGEAAGAVNQGLNEGDGEGGTGHPRRRPGEVPGGGRRQHD